MLSDRHEDMRGPPLDSYCLAESSDIEESALSTNLPARGVRVGSAFRVANLVHEEDAYDRRSAQRSTALKARIDSFVPQNLSE